MDALSNRFFPLLFTTGGPFLHHTSTLQLYHMSSWIYFLSSEVDGEAGTGIDDDAPPPFPAVGFSVVDFLSPRVAFESRRTISEQAKKKSINEPVRINGSTHMRLCLNL